MASGYFLRRVSVFFRFDSMIIMLVGEFDFGRIIMALQTIFQSTVGLVRDKDGLQGTTTTNSTVANGGHRVRYSDRLQ